MALRNIREIGDPILLKPCKEVTELTPRLKELIEDMFETMYDADGVGLAAPQVGILKKICIVDISTDEEPSEPYVFINPEVLEVSGEQEGYEGCLSVPGKTGMVKRPNYAKIKARNENFEEFTLECEELLARAVLHECDHLEGKLYVDYVNGELKNIEDVQEEEDNRKKGKKKKRL